MWKKEIKLQKGEIKHEKTERWKQELIKERQSESKNSIQIQLWNNQRQVAVRDRFNIFVRDDILRDGGTERFDVNNNI